MEWKEWIGKRIFVQLKSGGVYSGKVIDVDDSAEHLVFFKIIDKYGSEVVFIQSEIIKISEEKEDLKRGIKK